MNRRESYIEVEDYVTYDVALGLKEAGFDVPCGEYYHIGEGRDSLEATGKDDYDFVNSESRYRAAAPSIQEALKWFRKEHHISIEPCLNPITCDSGEIWYVNVRGYVKYHIDYCSIDFTTYEEAVEDGFLKALAFIRNYRHGDKDKV